MALLIDLLVRLGAAVVVSILFGALVIVGPDQLRSLWDNLRERIVRAWRPLLALGVVLVVNKVAREVGPTISWIIGINITGTIYAIEGGFVATVQSIANPSFTLYFSVAYVYMYVFLLVFPFLAYLALADPRPLRELAAAYIFNYALGLVCYILFVSYGPRNLLPEMVDSLLYSTYPNTQLLTRQVNATTNVFPSLHTSTSATVALLAWRTRETYPRWLYVAAPMAGSIIVATMYLGIHWGIDVLAGLALAYLSVRLAERYADYAAGREREDDEREGPGEGDPEDAGPDPEVGAPRTGEAAQESNSTS